MTARKQSAAERARARCLFALVACAVLACSSPGHAPGDATATGGTGGTPMPDAGVMLPAVTHPDPELDALGSREQTRDRVCARNRGDAFATALCGSGEAPKLADMSALLALVRLDSERAFALTGNSTSLVSKSVSALNPRLLVFPRVGDDLAPPANLTAVGFVRGEQFAEIVSRDPTTNDLNFYLVSFEQQCSYSPGGCDLANLLTEEIEHDWTTYSVYDQDDLERTSFDCMSCHRPGGYGTPRILRMQELTSPWLHWFPQRFVQRTDSDRALAAEFLAVHDQDTQYGGVPIATIASALDEGSAAQLEALVRAEGYAAQPNPFDPQIVKEAQSGTSATWQARFDAHLRGEAIAVPYPGVDVTDPTKRDAATQSYRNVVQGTAARDTLLDLRAVFSDDATLKLSFAPQPGSDGRTVLLQMCGRCHDGRGDPSLAKNQFNVRQLESMPRALKDMAVARIQATDDSHMPPWRSGALTPEALQAALAELAK